jgi:hypothetical protein
MKKKLEIIAITVFNLVLIFVYVWNILINIV